MTIEGDGPDLSRLIELGFELDSSERQLKNGTFLFYDDQLQRNYFFYTRGPTSGYHVRMLGIEWVGKSGSMSPKVIEVSWKDAVSAALAFRERELKRLSRQEDVEERDRLEPVLTLRISHVNILVMMFMHSLIEAYPVFCARTGTRMSHSNFDKIVNENRCDLFTTWFIVDVPMKRWGVFKDAVKNIRRCDPCDRIVASSMMALRTPRGNLKQPRRVHKLKFTPVEAFCRRESSRRSQRGS